MYEYEIEGGFPIKGEITASGNKNAALPCIAATLLTDEPVILKNIPEIEDTGVMLNILQSFGAKAEKLKVNTWKIEAKDVESCVIPAELSKKIRASILFAGPMVARLGKAEMLPPGGDVIGRRRLDTHFIALEQLGAQVKVNGHFVFTANKLIGTDIFLDECSVTATENAVMAAVLAEGKTTITNAASEPHIQDLCNMLCAMGAKITGIGSNILYIDGVRKLHGCEFEIGPDYMEIGSYIGLAAATRGSVIIKGVKNLDMRPLKVGFAKLGISWMQDGETITVSSIQEMKTNADVGTKIPKIDDSPWPGFPPDLTSIMTVVATQVEGTVLIFEKMFESRMFFVDKLISMGAQITLCDPHRAVVSGPSPLHGDHLVSPDVRAGMAMVIAAMAARGTSRISNVYQIERGYEHLVERLQSLGGHIKRVNVD
ncbi:UDP-N-acetylglucosamine 1-carboxyvinyltransferase [Treponema sp.]|uniref:UDP-N-acetylglucosamine 1-carboxyvinyltransferase n=1 Tax=Treponema sp. TaxID=166 RepID=UPI002A816E4F|nr:UDP-N-acetylglucosamine 1-carboxyvinyltransferase [Treponema sp.]MCI6442836.1 UDP-N-acetylglucosamine 1-carboxyvinyltransferase [Spirochaetia bacterium]MDY4133602.1 UDP-N-acetylglucosamine 1-carboxyvinyltransferase [Treponema sp.]